MVRPASHQISRVRRYSRNRGTSLATPSPTGLSPFPAARSSGVRLTCACGRGVSRPLPAIRSSPPPAAPTGSYAGAVWAPPRSLAATQGIFSVPAGTEMFQFPACPPRSRGTRGCPGWVAPFGHLWITGCQRLPRAFRRVAASFIGRMRQGIHRAPIFADLHPSSSLPAPATHRRGVRLARGSVARPRWISSFVSWTGQNPPQPPHGIRSGRPDPPFTCQRTRHPGARRGQHGPPRRAVCTRWSRGDSNPGPPPCKGGALPAKLRPQSRRLSWSRCPRSGNPPARRRGLTSPATADGVGGRAWTRTRGLGLIRAAL